MKTTKQTLLSIAIIAALPFVANATPTTVTSQTPAAVGENGTVNIVAHNGPYQIATIGEHDDEHIATTAYVKGAYNDSIRAVNKVEGSIEEFRSEYDEFQGFVDYTVGELRDVLNSKQDDLGFVGVEPANEVAGKSVGYVFGDSQARTSAISGMSDMAVSAEGVIAAIDEYNDALADRQRVTIYTTWGNDTSAATTNVSLTMLP